MERKSVVLVERNEPESAAKGKAGRKVTHTRQNNRAEQMRMKVRLLALSLAPIQLQLTSFILSTALQRLKSLPAAVHQSAGKGCPLPKRVSSAHGGVSPRHLYSVVKALGKVTSTARRAAWGSLKDFARWKQSMQPLTNLHALVAIHGLKAGFQCISGAYKVGKMQAAVERLKRKTPKLLLSLAFRDLKSYRPAPAVPLTLIRPLFNVINHKRLHSKAPMEHAVMALVRSTAAIRRRNLDAGVTALKSFQKLLNIRSTQVRILKALLGHRGEKRAIQRWKVAVKEECAWEFVTHREKHVDARFWALRKSLKGWRKEAKITVALKRRLSAVFFVVTQVERMRRERENAAFTVLQRANQRAKMVKRTLRKAATRLQVHLLRRFLWGFGALQSNSRYQAGRKDALLRLAKVVTNRVKLNQIRGLSVLGISQQPLQMPAVSFRFVLRMVRTRLKSALTNIIIFAKNTDKTERKVMKMVLCAEAKVNELRGAYWKQWKASTKLKSILKKRCNEAVSTLNSAVKRVKFEAFTAIRESKVKATVEVAERLRKAVLKGSWKVMKSRAGVQRLASILTFIRRKAQKRSFFSMRFLYFREKRAKATFSVLKRLIYRRLSKGLRNIEDYSYGADIVAVDPWIVSKRTAAFRLGALLRYKGKVKLLETLR